MNVHRKTLAGRKFGHLVVIRRGLGSAFGPRWVCECACGRSRTVLETSLMAGDDRCCAICEIIPQPHHPSFSTP